MDASVLFCLLVPFILDFFAFLLTIGVCWSLAFSLLRPVV